MMIRNILAGALFGFMMLAASSQVFAQSEFVEKRQNLMKNNSAAVKAIKGAVDAKDYATIELKAKDIMGNAEKIPELFPKGSNVGKTKAKVEIWEKADDFAKNHRNLRKAATELADAAKSKDDAAIGVKVKALGDVCGACHKTNRAEKYAE
jgi:cytochrome c556